MRTRIISLIGATQRLGYVPPHGALVLAGYASHVVEGDLRTSLASGRGRYWRSQELAGLNADIAAGRICLEQIDEAPCSSSSSSSA